MLRAGQAYYHIWPLPSGQGICEPSRPSFPRLVPTPHVTGKSQIDPLIPKSVFLVCCAWTPCWFSIYFQINKAFSPISFEDQGRKLWRKIHLFSATHVQALTVFSGYISGKLRVSYAKNLTKLGCWRVFKHRIIQGKYKTSTLCRSKRQLPAAVVGVGGLIRKPKFQLRLLDCFFLLRLPCTVWWVGNFSFI